MKPLEKSRVAFSLLCSSGLILKIINGPDEKSVVLVVR